VAVIALAQPDGLARVLAKSSQIPHERTRRGARAERGVGAHDVPALIQDALPDETGKAGTADEGREFLLNLSCADHRSSPCGSPSGSIFDWWSCARSTEADRLQMQDEGRQPGRAWRADVWIVLK